jgi:16S rRNA processing protein RimM
MEPDSHFEIGFIRKPHGLKGALSIQLDVDDVSNYADMESVIVKIGDQMVPFFIESLQLSGAKGIIQLEDITSVEGAHELKSCPLFLPIDMLPALSGEKFYYHEVIGYHVYDRKLGKLGVIENVFSGGRQDLISMRYKNAEVLIPVVDDIVKGAEHSGKLVKVELPDGLLDVYVN